LTPDASWGIFRDSGGTPEPKKPEPLVEYGQAPQTDQSTAWKTIMAKECHIQKHKRQQALWEKLQKEEQEIMALPKEKREEALAEFTAKRVKNRQFKARRYNRCSITGRAHGTTRYFGVCRQQLREMAHQGLLPGVTKSSW
jgi:small subunit ribosomal protein S14